MALKIKKTADKMEKKNGSGSSEDRPMAQLIKLQPGETVENVALIDMYPMTTKYGKTIMVVFADVEGDKKKDLPEDEMKYIVIGETGKGAAKRYHQQYGIFADMYDENQKGGSIFGKMLVQEFGIFKGGDQDSTYPMAENFVKMNEKFRGVVINLGKVKSKPKNGGMPYYEMRFEIVDDEKLTEKAEELVDMYGELNPEAFDKTYGEDTEEGEEPEDEDEGEDEAVTRAKELLGKGKNKKSLTSVIQSLVDEGYSEVDAMKAAQAAIA